jgi:hypothetical protein
MNVQRLDLLFSVAVTTMVATAAMGQSAAPTATPASDATPNPAVPGGASIPDFSGSWSHITLNGLELPLSGPGPVRNRARLRGGPQAGVGNIRQLVGDYTNAILQPWAAAVVKKFGDISLAGEGFPTPRNQCWPEQVPFVFINYGMQILQQVDKITILYPFDHQFRQVRMNQAHPIQVTPSWYGDSVGHYESDTLVIDTVGVKVAPFSMMDWFGTPFTEALHLVERYRFLDYEATKEAIGRDAKEHFQQPNPDNGPRFDPNYKGKGLQIHLTVEDTGAFTMPWSATVTFRRALDEHLELVCAESLVWFPGKESAVPRADKPDF